MTRLLRQITSPLTPYWKFGIDIGLWTLSAPLALFARVDVDAVRFTWPLVVYMGASLLVKAPLIYAMRLHYQRWRTVSVRDLTAILRVISIASTILFVALLFGQRFVALPRSVPIVEGAFAVILIGGIRLASRLIHERIAASTFHEERKRVLIIGAGETGTMIAREMLRHPESGLYPVGFLDDDPRKRHDWFLGLPVLGEINDLPGVAEELGADQALIAMSTANGDVIRKVVSLAAGIRITYRIIPAFHELLSGKASLSQIRYVDVQDLLRREPINLNTGDIAHYLEGKVVLVTGAGGSIGSEIARQVAAFQPKRIILLDHTETGLYYLERELESAYPTVAYTSVIADVRRADKLEQVFTDHAPQVVFHAAAHKHVPMMEANPDEAVLNNVGGTETLLQASIRHGIARFVNISTDKAVRPSSVMGACKRIAEYLVQDAASQLRADQVYTSVRFGNVLGSQGSVVPVFREQIRRGGPVTVTHPDMLRYFMTIPEAAQLVLQAGGLGQNGTVYVLDMGEPVKIVDLANDLIRLSGLIPGKDIAITFTGIRPGEKLFEELLTDAEGLEASKYEGILIAPQNGAGKHSLGPELKALYAAAAAHDPIRIKQCLKTLVPSYQLVDENRQSEKS